MHENSLLQELGKRPYVLIHEDEIESIMPEIHEREKVIKEMKDEIMESYKKFKSRLL